MNTGNNQVSKKFTHDFLAQNRTGTLATVDANHYPDISPVFCVIDKNLSLFFTSRVEGRKFINLLTNPNVALSFTNEENMEAVLVRGVAQRINQMELEQKVIQNLMIDKQSNSLRSLPSMQLYESGHTNEVAIVKIVPTEITYANFAPTKDNSAKVFFQKIL